MSDERSSKGTPKNQSPRVARNQNGREQQNPARASSETRGEPTQPAVRPKDRKQKPQSPAASRDTDSPTLAGTSERRRASKPPPSMPQPRPEDKILVHKWVVFLDKTGRLLPPLRTGPRIDETSEFWARYNVARLISEGKLLLEKEPQDPNQLRVSYFYQKNYPLNFEDVLDALIYFYERHGPALNAPHPQETTTSSSNDDPAAPDFPYFSHYELDPLNAETIVAQGEPSATLKRKIRRKSTCLTRESTREINLNNPSELPGRETEFTKAVRVERLIKSPSRSRGTYASMAADYEPPEVWGTKYDRGQMKSSGSPGELSRAQRLAANARAASRRLRTAVGKLRRQALDYITFKKRRKTRVLFEALEFGGNFWLVMRSVRRSDLWIHLGYRRKRHSTSEPTSAGRRAPTNPAQRSRSDLRSRLSSSRSLSVPDVTGVGNDDTESPSATLEFGELCTPLQADHHKKLARRVAEEEAADGADTGSSAARSSPLRFLLSRAAGVKTGSHSSSDSDQTEETDRGAESASHRFSPSSPRESRTRSAHRRKKSAGRATKVEAADGADTGSPAARSSPLRNLLSCGAGVETGPHSSSDSDQTEETDRGAESASHPFGLSSPRESRTLSAHPGEESPQEAAKVEYCGDADIESCIESLQSDSMGSIIAPPRGRYTDTESTSPSESHTPPVVQYKESEGATGGRKEDPGTEGVNGEDPAGQDGSDGSQGKRSNH